jgi:hypothetical protein
MVFTCDKCCKILTSKKGFANHVMNCDGVHPLECRYCNKIFSCKQSKYQHCKRCSLKVQDNANDISSCADNLTNKTVKPNHILTNNISGDNNTTNSHCTINHITNNNSFVIKLEQKLDKETKFETEEITSDKFLECLYDARSQKQYHLDVLSDFCDMVFSIPRNKCVKKDNLRTNYSKIHLGNNNWKVVADRNLYEKLLMDITKTFMKKLDEFDNIKDLNTKYKKLLWDVRGRTDHLSYGSYDEEEKELINEYKIAKENVKYAVHNNSK